MPSSRKRTRSSTPSGSTSSRRSESATPFFLFLPYTTLFYVLMENWQNGIDGFGWFLVSLGFLIDISNYVGSARRRTVIVENSY